MKCCPKILAALALTAIAAFPSQPTAAAEPSRPAPAMGPLRPHPANPRYFIDGSGKAVYLTGSHTWSNLQDQGTGDPPLAFDFDRYLDFLQKHHHNFIRLWAWEQARWAPWSDGKGQDPRDWFICPNPYARSGPGLARDGRWAMRGAAPSGWTWPRRLPCPAWPRPAIASPIPAGSTWSICPTAAR